MRGVINFDIVQKIWDCGISVHRRPDSCEELIHGHCTSEGPPDEGE